MIVNPGAGKSTILNGIVGKAAFNSGVSVGTGLTTTLDVYEGDGLTLYDTPGLSDIERAKEAAKEIDSLLQKQNDIKMCFVVVLEGGRASPEDATTITAVLSAITGVDINDRFGVIFNKVTPK